MLKIVSGVLLFSCLVSAEPISEFEARPDDSLHPVLVSDEKKATLQQGDLDPYAYKRLHSLHHRIKDLTTVGGDSNTAINKNHVDFQQSCQKMLDRYKSTVAKETLLLQQLDEKINHRDIKRTNKSLEKMKKRFTFLLESIKTDYKGNKEEAAKSARHWKEYSGQIRKMKAKLARQKGHKDSKAMGDILSRMGSVTHHENGKESRQFAEQRAQFMKTQQLGSAYQLAVLIEQTKANLAKSSADKKLAALRIERARHRVLLQEAVGEQLETHLNCAREKDNYKSQLDNHKHLKESLDALVAAIHSK